ncbi:diguanylate cyclase domain-containing protein [Deinococcus peraridilitoris]|uniref:Diguanylate cyclase (GGDEF) domain-containing protein n=1 Tax=Deinococcus peraridilitoris (strain DSM 19664 / LMG 22246 / CIP 109416 / KR-200) TaxID=937777 RepID=K9ZVY1_DEIPD|nr:diguanylate cyclase [Deinococcus peraridilitoris]AFZ65788.1 diguanylate cyclase (GGDEF) domain-containing protein [Deinococcus peraridilitoris DSM 19664]
MNHATNPPWLDASERGGHGLWMLGTHDSLSTNQAFREQLRASPASLPEWLLQVHPEDRAEVHAALRTVSNGARLDVTYRTMSGPQQRWLRLTGAAQGTGNQPSLGGAQIDLTEQHEREARLRRGAYQDPLTGLPNRVLLIEQLEEVLAEVRSGHRQAGLLFLDLNRFRQTNDMYGHAVGDVLVACVAARLRETLGRDVLLGRYGGDEFAALIPGHGEQTLLDAARRVHAAFVPPIDLGAHRLQASFTIGGVQLGARHRSAGDALAQADAAMYRAKRDGQVATRLYDDVLERERRNEQALGQALTSVLREGALQTHYLPLRLDGRLVGAEVRAGLPGQAASLAPQAGLTTAHALEVDLWLLSHVAAQTHAPGLTRLRPASALSELQHALAAILAAEAAVRMGGGTLQLVFSAAPWGGHARSALHALRARGVEIVLSEVERLSLAALMETPADAVILPHDSPALLHAIVAELGWSVERAVADDASLSRDAFLRLAMMR